MREKSYTVESVLRALNILEFLAQQGGSSRVTDIAQAIGCSKNTAFRLLQTLRERGFIRQADDASYELTYKLLHLGESVLRNSDLHEVARPYLQEFVEQFGETINLGILDGIEVVYVARVLGTLPYHTSSTIGSRDKAHSTALGKAILAFSPQATVSSVLAAGLPAQTQHTITSPERLLAELSATAARGYSIDNQENVLGIICVGAPIFDRRSDVVGAISTSALHVRLTDDRIPVVAEKLISTAAVISQRLGYSAASVRRQGNHHRA